MRSLHQWSVADIVMATRSRVKNIEKIVERTLFKVQIDDSDFINDVLYRGRRCLQTNGDYI